MVYTKSAIIAAALSIAAIATPVAANRQGQSGSRIAMRPDGPSWEEIQKMYPPEVLKAIRREISEELEARSPRNLGPFVHGFPHFIDHGPVMNVGPIARENDDEDVEARELDARGGRGYRPRKRPQGRRPIRRPHGKRPIKGRPIKGRPGKGKPRKGRPFRGRPGKGKPGKGKPKVKPFKPAVMPKPGGMPKPGQQQPNLPGKVNQPPMEPPMTPPPVMPPSGPDMQGAPTPEGNPGAPGITSPDDNGGAPQPGSNESIPPPTSPPQDTSAPPTPKGAPPQKKPPTLKPEDIKKPSGAKRELGGFAGFLARRGYVNLDELD